jgi:hypothetical protein
MGANGRKLRCLYHLTIADTCGADAGAAAYTVHYRVDAAKIRIPAAPAGIIRVTDNVAKMRLLAAQFTCHGHDLLLRFR